MEEAEMQRRKLTLEDEQQIWKDITLTQYINAHVYRSELGADVLLCLLHQKEVTQHFNPESHFVSFQLEEDSGCFIPRRRSRPISREPPAHRPQHDQSQQARRGHA